MAHDTGWRLQSLRAELATSDLDGFIMTTGDEHVSEFVMPHSERVTWISGFTGATGKISGLAEHAAVFVDLRYTGIVREPADPVY